MPWTQKQMLRDANGDLIPQYWDVVEQEFKPLTGSDGANDVRLTGSMPELYTVIDETDIPANGQSSLVDMQLDGREKEVYVWVNTDSDDWVIRTNYLELDTGRLDTALYPRGRGTAAYERYHQPKKFFYVGTNTEFLIEEIGNLEQAIMQATYFQGAKIRFDNQSSESVFATVRILKKY